MIGMQETIIILIVALVLFGPSKLPELARSLGNAMNEFKKAQISVENEINRNINFNDDRKEKDRDIKIQNLAIEMGLSVDNKTTEQLVEEIRHKINSGTDIAKHKT